MTANLRIMSAIPDGVAGSSPSDEPLPPHDAGCLGCGPANPAGLHLRAYRDGDEVTASVVFDQRHAGVVGLAHGGAVATACDDLFAYVLHVVDVPAVTRRLDVGYRAPVRLGVPHHFTARLERRQGRRLFMTATGVAEGGGLAVEARAVFVVVPTSHWLDHGATVPDRFVAPRGGAEAPGGSAGRVP